MIMNFVFVTFETYDRIY